MCKDRLLKYSDQQDYLQQAERSSAFDWRYYLTRYAAMHEGKSGIYVAASKVLGFDLCMLNKTLTNSNYRDPTPLSRSLERWREGTEAVVDPWFTGWRTERWLRLGRSGVELRSVDAGFQLRAPQRVAEREPFSVICSKHGVDATLLLTIPHQGGVDMQDRVRAAATLLAALAEAGL